VAKVVAAKIPHHLNQLITSDRLPLMVRSIISIIVIMIVSQIIRQITTTSHLSQIKVVNCCMTPKSLQGK
jgi:hypothetical protein